ncbi:hypothetical protein CR513_35776, partial [Mucuna pruriens]
MKVTQHYLSKLMGYHYKTQYKLGGSNIVGGLLLYKEKIWLISTSKFQTLLLKEFHKSLIGGHAKVTITPFYPYLSKGRYFNRFHHKAFTFEWITIRNHLGILPTHFTTYKVAKICVSLLCKLHELPKSNQSSNEWLNGSHEMHH